MKQFVFLVAMGVSLAANSASITEDLEWCRDAVDQLTVIEQTITKTKDDLARESMTLDYWSSTIKGHADRIDAKRKILEIETPSMEEISVFNRDVAAHNQDVTRIQLAVADWNSKNSRLITAIGEHKSASAKYFTKCNGMTAPTFMIDRVCGRNYRMSSNKFCASFAFK